MQQHPIARDKLVCQDLGGSGGDSQLYFRILPGREKEGIAAVEEVLRRHDINPDAGTVRVVNYGDLIAEKYRKEQNFLWLYSVLSAVGLGIALFGMITLLSADLQRQRRAIAIRRVFGAHYRDCLRWWKLPSLMQTQLTSVFRSTP